MQRPPSSTPRTKRACRKASGREVAAVPRPDVARRGPGALAAEVVQEYPQTRAHRRKRRKQHRGREGHDHEHDDVVDPTLRPAQHELEAPGLPARGQGEGGERVREHDGDPHR